MTPQLAALDQVKTEAVAMRNRLLELTEDERLPENVRDYMASISRLMTLLMFSADQRAEEIARLVCDCMAQQEGSPS